MYFDLDVSENVTFRSRITAVCAHTIFHESLVISCCLLRHHKVAAVYTLIFVRRHKRKRFTMISSK